MAIDTIGLQRPRRGDSLAAVRLVINPSSDHQFRQKAEALVESTETPEELQQLLRGEYDRARVVRGVTDVFERWYVYRDGHWINTPTHQES